MPTINKPTDSTLATGLSNIATAIGVAPTGEIAINQNGTYNVTSYASASVSVAGSQAFRLIPANVTVENGSFSLEYEGTPPNVNTASIIETVEGTNQTGLSYSVSYSNGTATFTLIGTADGVVIARTNAVVNIGDTSVVIGATGLPVKYEPRIVSINDVVVTDRADITETEIHIVPTGVSPKADLNTVNAIGTVFSNGELYSELELEVNKVLPQYPEDYTLVILNDAFDSTVENGYMFVSTEPNSGTGGQTFKVGLTFED